MANVTESIAEYVIQASYEDVPCDVVEKAKHLILDAIGCGLGGTKTELGSTAVSALLKGSSGAAPVIGSPYQTSDSTSAYLNAMLINALDFDESGPGGHVSSTIVGTIFGLLGTPGASGRDMLLSYILGLEICTRIALADWPTMERFNQVWGLGTNQTFGAVVAAAKLKRLDKSQTLNAIGIAGASAPVPSGQKWGWDNRPLTWMKDAVAPPAQVGVMASSLAQSGFKGCIDILDGSTGFWRMAGSDRCESDLMTKGLGVEYFTRSASYKTYSCCWFIHPTLDALREIVDAQKLSHNDISRIDVWSLTDLKELFSSVKPQAMVDAQFSLPYCVAMILLSVKPGPDWFDYDLYNDETVLSIGSKVCLHADRSADAIFHSSERRISAKVSVTTMSGDQYDLFVPAPKGSPSRPISNEDIAEKYMDLAVPVLGIQHAEKLMNFVLQIDTAETLDPLCRLIHP